MIRIINWFENTSPLQCVIGIIVVAVVIRVIFEIIFED
jgi:hypothetical protein